MIETLLLLSKLDKLTENTNQDNKNDTEGKRKDLPFKHLSFTLRLSLFLPLLILKDGLFQRLIKHFLFLVIYLFITFYFQFHSILRIYHLKGLQVKLLQVWFKILIQKPVLFIFIPNKKMNYQPKILDSPPKNYHERPFANQPPYYAPLSSPINHRIQNVQFTYQQTPHSNAKTPINVKRYDFESKVDMNVSSPQKNKQSLNKTPSIKRKKLEQEKKFAPLSYKKETQTTTQDKKDSGSYAKQTLQIVMVGFLLLMLIAGSLYGLIILDKMKYSVLEGQNKATLVNTSTQLNTSVKIGNSTKVTKKEQQPQSRTIPAEQRGSLGLGIMDHLKSQKSSSSQSFNSRTNKIETTHTFSQGTYLLLRKNNRAEQSQNKNNPIN